MDKRSEVEDNLEGLETAIAPDRKLSDVSYPSQPGSANLFTDTIVNPFSRRKYCIGLKSEGDVM